MDGPSPWENNNGSAMAIAQTGGGGEAPANPITLAQLNFALLIDVNPYPGSAAWPLDRDFGAQCQIIDGVWRSITANGQQSNHAIQSTLDLTGEPRVFVAANDLLVDAGSSDVALMMTSNYTPGATWRALQNGAIDGYRLNLNASSLTVFGVSAGTTYDNNNFGDAIAGASGSLAKIEMRVTIGASSNKVQIFIDDVQFGSDWIDSDPSRVTDLRTVGGSPIFGASFTSMSRIFAGTF